jgi:HTH-like domain
MSVASHIASQRTDHGVPHAVSCRALGVSESWFYKWHRRPATPRQRRRVELTSAIREAFEASGRTYGSPRVLVDLRAASWRVTKHTVAKIMAGRVRLRRRRLVRATELESAPSLRPMSARTPITATTTSRTTTAATLATLFRDGPAVHMPPRAGAVAVTTPEAARLRPSVSAGDAAESSTANAGSGALPPPPSPAPPPPLWNCGGTAPTRRASSSPAWSIMSMGSSGRCATTRRAQVNPPWYPTSRGHRSWCGAHTSVRATTHSPTMVTVQGPALVHSRRSGCRELTRSTRWCRPACQLYSRCPRAWPRRNNRQMRRPTLCGSRPRRARNPIRSPLEEIVFRRKQGEIVTGGSEQAGDVYCFPSIAAGT